ncbi:Pre-mRNA-splicing factor SYF2 [Saxophila tyrrhenica]|uniref:Pre-mRNA-splicing factor SYF2 n=1 Tax=Saxophila tyrrhenica TaxID=1690608 RepID=A0AAV9PEI1_9PEZI|nr:Pre-mRNA-splicing factor SYF2 [Saxophila tyrrhenica]
MPAKLKRKGSPGLAEESAEPSKRRFAEDAQEPAHPESTQEEPTEQEEPPADSAPAPSEDAEPSPAPPDDRAARFAALRARHTASKKSNLDSTRSEARNAAVNPAQLSSLNRKRDIMSHKLLKSEVESSGEDFERKRAWDWTVDESERWDERMAEKKARKENVAFQDYSAEAGKVYERQIAQMVKANGKEGGDGRKGEYEKEKEEAIERAVRSGGLEIVETENGELIAVDKDGSWLSTDVAAGGPGSFGKKPSKDAIDRLVSDIKKAEEVRLKKRRERGRADPMEEGGDITYINEKNKQFNMKLARFYDKYTSEIRDSFERGTAI